MPESLIPRPVPVPTVISLSHPGGMGQVGTGPVPRAPAPARAGYGPGKRRGGPNPESLVCSTRLEDWPERLDGYLRECAARAFAWGEHDCCLFVCSAVLEMTGKDPAANFRSRYSTRAGAYQLLREATGQRGFAKAIAAICETYSFPPVPVLLARRGDVVVLRGDDDAMGIGVVALDGTRVVSVGPSGLVYAPLARIMMAWSI